MAFATAATGTRSYLAETAKVPQMPLIHILGSIQRNSRKCTRQQPDFDFKNSTSHFRRGSSQTPPLQALTKTLSQLGGKGGIYPPRVYSMHASLYRQQVPASEMTYIVSGGALNSTHSLRQQDQFRSILLWPFCI